MAQVQRKFRIEFPGVVKETLLEEGGSLSSEDTTKFKQGDRVRITWDGSYGTIRKLLPKYNRCMVTLASGSIMECSFSNLERA